MKVDLNSIEVRAMIFHLESLGYKVTPARNISLQYHRVTLKEPIPMDQFQWEAVHMIAGQLRPDHLMFETSEEGLGHRLSAKLYL